MGFAKFPEGQKCPDIFLPDKSDKTCYDQHHNQGRLRTISAGKKQERGNGFNQHQQRKQPDQVDPVAPNSSITHPTTSNEPEPPARRLTMSVALETGITPETIRSHLRFTATHPQDDQEGLRNSSPLPLAIGQTIKEFL
ncbi:MAG: hypothetical protein H7839_23055 [Magnetococcus sp. YQC-5]